MTSKQTILTLEKTVEKVLECAKSEKTNIVILLLEQEDIYATDLEKDNKDICERGNSLPKMQQKLWKYIKEMTGPIMKKLCLNLSQMLPSSSVCQIHSRKKTETVYWKKTTNLKNLQESELEQLSESHPHLLFQEPVVCLFVNNNL